MLGAISYVMKDVTKVILGASAMMANGTALSRVGTAVVALMGHSSRLPIIFCCETYKFCERVQLDAIVSNEVADPNDLVVKNADPSQTDAPGNIRKVDPEKDLANYQSIPSLCGASGPTPVSLLQLVILHQVRLSEVPSLAASS